MRSRFEDVQTDHCHPRVPERAALSTSCCARSPWPKPLGHEVSMIDTIILVIDR